MLGASPFTSAFVFSVMNGWLVAWIRKVPERDVFEEEKKAEMETISINVLD